MALEIIFQPEAEFPAAFETILARWFRQYGAGTWTLPNHSDSPPSLPLVWHLQLKEDDFLLAMHDLHAGLYHLGVSFEVNSV